MDDRIAGTVGGPHALKQAGADRVTVVVLGRHLDPSFELTEPLLAATTGRRFRLDDCVLHAG